MPEPDESAPASTPYRGGTSNHGQTSASEAKMKRWSQRELEVYWRSVVNDHINAEKSVVPYASPTGDKAFEKRVNQIMREHLQLLLDNPELLHVVDYTHQSREPITGSSAKNVAQGADPINLFNGEFVYSNIDFQINGAGLDFRFVRTYSQLSRYRGPLGACWDHCYNLWIRVDWARGILHRSTGALREQVFIRHEHHDYWVPPDGVAAIVLERGDSFVTRFPDGTKIVYQPHEAFGATIHVASRLEDRYGNELRFVYSDGNLVRAEVNDASRVLELRYDTSDRITAIRDFSGRVWSYHYDDIGNLIATTTPATDRRPRGLTTCYEYAGPLVSDPELRHALVAVIDANGRPYLENEYGQQPHLLSHGRVVRQRQGGGDVLLDYSDVIEDFDVPYETHERPTHQTIVTERDGRQAAYVFNGLGNMLRRSHYARLGGLPKIVSHHYRYNRDGNLIAALSPTGAVTQALFARDLYERRFPPADGYRYETDENLTATVRAQFGNLLAVVKRGRPRRPSPGTTARSWGRDVFGDIFHTEPEDVVQKFSYDAELNQLLTSSDPRVTRSADPSFAESAEYDRRLTKYAYASATAPLPGLLTSIELPTPTHPDGTAAQPVTTRFVDYDERGRLLRVIAPNGLETVNRYADGSEGSVVGLLMETVLDPGGFALRSGYERDELGRITKSMRPKFFELEDGRFATISEYDELGQRVRSTSTPPFSIDIHNRYDRVGTLASSATDLVDASGTRVGAVVTRNRYDEELNLISQTVSDESGEQSKRMRVLHDRAARPFLTIGPTGRMKKVYFNERSLVSKTVEDYGGVHATVRSYYDADGRLVRVIDPRGFEERYVYDALGRLVDETDAAGNRIVRRYDKVGNLVVECLYERIDDDTFALRARRELSYDELGRLVIAGVNRFEAAPAVPRSDLTGAFAESGPGELLAVQFFYDASGNVVRRVDQDGREFSIEYDILGRATRRVDPDGNELRLEYDAEGNVTRVDRREVTRDLTTNEVVRERFFAVVLAYDELNRIVERTTSIGSYRYEYDGQGNRVAIEDPNGNRVENTFDVFGRLTETRRSHRRFEPDEVPSVVRTAFTYDKDDQCTSLTDPLGRTTLFHHDGLGRLVSTTFPDGSADSSVYDRASNLVEYRDRNGAVRKLEWDGLSRNVAMLVESVMGGALDGATSYRAEYDALGRITRAENDFVVTRYDYDSLDHTLAEVNSFTASTGLDPSWEYAISRRFSNTGALLEITYPSGRRIVYRRDVLDRVTRVEQAASGTDYPGDVTNDPELVVADLEYDGLTLGKVSRPSGVTTELQYDFAGRVVQIVHGVGGSPFHTIQFLYDRVGNVVQQVESSPDHDGTLVHRYDSVHRLIETRASATATLLNLAPLSPDQPLPRELPDHHAIIESMMVDPGDGSLVAYTYDLVGNRLTLLSQGALEEYETNGLDQYTTVAEEDLEYDGNGNLIEDPLFSYRYDQRNQLVAIRRKADGHETRFFFDSFGRRWLTRRGPVAEVAVHDWHNLLEQYVDGSLRRSIVTNGAQDGVLLVAVGGRDITLLSDLSRSVRHELDGSTHLRFYLYDPFGNLQKSTNPSDHNPFRFAGKRLLEDTGKIDFVFRAYDPALGRFMQRDPKGYVDGTNFYAFLRNNPLGSSDELGLESRSERAPAPVVAKLGAEVAYRNPKGFTLAVPDNFDAEKIGAYKERIHDPADRGVGIRSRPAGAKNATDDIRQRNQPLRDTYEAGLPGGHRPAGTQIDHTVELQHIIRRNPSQWASGADTVRPKDHRVQDSSLNHSQGSSARWTKKRQVDAGAPLDTSAGGVAREQDVGKLWNRPGYRTVHRWWGNYARVGGLGQSLFDFRSDISEGNWGGAFLNGSGFLGGGLELGGLLARSPTLLRFGRFAGAPAAVVGSGLIGVRIGNNLYENYVDHDLFMDAGSWVEDKTGNKYLGATAAAAVAVGDAIASAPEAAVDYASETWTLDPDEIDWDRTFKPWKW